MRYWMLMSLLTLALPMATPASASTCNLPDYVRKIDDAASKKSKWWCLLSRNGARPANGDEQLAKAILNGSVPGTRDEALMLLRRAADVDFSSSRREYVELKLAKKHATGKDFDQVLGDLQRWAKQGYGHAALTYAFLHAGRVPIKDDILRRKDITTFMTWLRIAHAIGDRPLIKGQIAAVRQIAKEMIRVTESPDLASSNQIAESKKRARQWLKKHRPASLKDCRFCQ